MNPDYNNGILARLIKEELRKLLPLHLERLRNRVEQARDEIYNS